jgi:sensor histidine kinase regulating citrate/malate metabolism
MCIFSNLLDNAIEGCQRNRESDNYIKIKTTRIGNYLGIKIINSKATEENILTEENIYRTTKMDKKNHGYGLRIIEEIISQYDGYKELQDNMSEFSAMVMLKLVPVQE